MTSALVRILAELGCFQGPGPTDPFWLWVVPGMLSVEATKSSLLRRSLKSDDLRSLPFASCDEASESFLVHKSLKNDNESLLLTVPIVLFLFSAGVPLMSLSSGSLFLFVSLSLAVTDIVL